VEKEVDRQNYGSDKMSHDQHKPPKPSGSGLFIFVSAGKMLPFSGFSCDIDSLRQGITRSATPERTARTFHA